MIFTGPARIHASQFFPDWCGAFPRQAFHSSGRTPPTKLQPLLIPARRPIVDLSVRQAAARSVRPACGGSAHGTKPSSDFSTWGSAVDGEAAAQRTHLPSVLMTRSGHPASRIRLAAKGGGGCTIRDELGPQNSAAPSRGSDGLSGYRADASSHSGNCRIDLGTQVVPLRAPARIIVGKPCFACGILPNQCPQRQIYSDRLV